MEFKRHLAYFGHSKILIYEISDGRNSNVYRDGLIETACDLPIFSLGIRKNIFLLRKRNERLPTYYSTPNAPEKAALVGR